MHCAWKQLFHHAGTHRPKRKGQTHLSGLFYNNWERTLRYPNLRYGNPTELAYYAMGEPVSLLARRLRRDERTVKDWISGRTRVPWWVPEILRLKRIEADLRHRQMGMGAMPARLGVVSADVIALAQPPAQVEPPRAEACAVLPLPYIA